MRPVPGGDALPASSSVKPRSRKSSIDHAAAPSSRVPTTFAMKRVEDLEPSMAARQDAAGAERQRAATFGVQSLADTLEAAFGAEATPASVQGESRDATPPTKEASLSRPAERTKASLSRERDRRKKRSSYVASRPSTPPNVVAPSPMPASVQSSTSGSASIQSLKLSDEDSLLDEVASQVIASRGDEDGDDEDITDTLHGASGCFPQLVMPSIQMPRRRPFTTRGKAMGKLKILVAGQAGIGKTSLIRSIVQLCEDIVHVDSLTPFLSTPQPNPPKPSSRKKKVASTSSRITEFHASTKPYPHWWTDLDESRILRRRKSSVDAVLERNICFVDTPGISSRSCEEDAASAIVSYVESLMHQTASIHTLDESDVLGVVSGSGGVLVDVVIYLLPPDQDITKDIDMMQRLSFLTNVIPVVAKSDTISVQKLVALKTSILARLQLTSVNPFLFGKPIDDALLAVQSLPVLASSQIHSESSSESSQYPFSTPTHPFAISSTIGSDNDIMDASLLMSPDYVQPLLPSELPTLVTQVFDPDSISWLRHSAAKRFLAWRKTLLSRDHTRQHTLPQPQSPTTASVGLKRIATGATTNSSVFSVTSPSGVIVPHPGTPFYASNLQSPFLTSSPSLSNSEAPDSPGSFSLAHYTNASRGELPLSEIRVAKWATDLHRSLRHERERFERVQREDRAKWLLERVGEEVSRGTIVAAAGGPPRADWAVVRHGDDKRVGESGKRFRGAARLDSRDPLGLCGLGDEVVRRGTVLVKVLGGVSVVGAVVVTLARSMGVQGFAGQLGWWGWVWGSECVGG